MHRKSHLTTGRVTTLPLVVRANLVGLGHRELPTILIPNGLYLELSGASTQKRQLPVFSPAVLASPSVRGTHQAKGPVSSHPHFELTPHVQNLQFWKRDLNCLEGNLGDAKKETRPMTWGVSLCRSSQHCKLAARMLPGRPGICPLQDI